MSNVSSTAVTEDWKRGPAIAAGVLLTSVNLIALLISLYVGAFRCNENCYEGTGWQDSPHSWQWNALWIVSGVALLLAIVGAVCAARRNILATYVLYLLSVCAVVAWGALLFS